ncbi:MAG TPA: MFS transporter, partial [Candidatus Saccharimonadales bacterium]
MMINNGWERLKTAKQLLSVMAAQSASVYANQVIAFVIPWLVLTKTGSATDAATVALATGLAAFLGILTGGLVTDRIGGRRVSMIADVLSAVTTVALAVTLFFDFFALWFVIISQIIGVFFDGPGAIAKNTIIPSAANEEKVPVVRAMGLQQTLQNLAMFIGPVSAGAIIAVLSESTTLLLASLLFVAAIVLISRLKRQVFAHQTSMSVRQAYHDTGEAIVFLAKEPFLGPMQLFGPLFAFFIVPLAVIIFPAWFIFAGQGSGALGLFLGLQAIGGMLGGFLFAAFAPKVPQRTWFFCAT